MRKIIIGLSVLGLIIVFGALITDNSIYTSLLGKEVSHPALGSNLTLGVIQSEFDSGVSEMEKSLYDQILKNFEIEYDIHTSIKGYDTLKALYDALKEGEVVLAMTNRGLPDDDVLEKFPMELQYSYGLYSESKYTLNYLNELLGGKSGFVEPAVMEEINKYFKEITFGDVQYESYDQMLSDYEKDHVSYLFMPYDGKELFLDNGKVLYLNCLLDDFRLTNTFYYKPSTIKEMEFLNQWFGHLDEGNDNSALETMVKDNALIIAKERYKEYINDKDIGQDEDEFITVIYSSQDIPLAIEDNLEPYGILPTYFQDIQTIVDKKVRFIHVDSIKDDEDLMAVADLYTKSAYEAAGLDIGENRTDMLFSNSTLIVGRIGEDKYVHANQLAMKEVGLVNGRSGSSNLKESYPEIKTPEYQDPKLAVEDLKKGIIDYMILDEYSMLFLTISDLTNELSILGEWRNNSNVYLYAPSMDEPSLMMINRALNYVDGEDALQNAIQEVVLKEQAKSDSKFPYLVIAALGLILLVSAYRGSRYRSEKRTLDYLATHDPLTNSLNLFGMKKKMMGKDAISDNFHLLLVDINQFKRINNSHSFAYGNKVLMELNQAMEAYVGNEGYVARNGSDEFVVALKLEKYKNNTGFIKGLYEELTKVLKSLVDYELSIGIGVATLKHFDELEEAFTRAENALNQQKEKAGSGIAYYTDELGTRLKLDKMLSNEIQRAFENHEFEMFYQPQFTKNGMEIVGCEALIRWRHPERGLLAPGKFLHLIRKENAIKRLDHYVLEHVSRQLEIWESQGIYIPKVSVNITPITLCDYEFLSTLKRVQGSYKYKHLQLCLEITEDDQMLDTKELEKLLMEIKSMGICVAIDDFGAGYSSLSYIVKYPAEYVKLDRSLVNNIVIKEQDFDFLKGIIHVLQGLGKIIIVEGVETIGQIEKLSHFDQLFIQGYCYSKPVSVEQLVHIWKKLDGQDDE